MNSFVVLTWRRNVKKIYHSAKVDMLLSVSAGWIVRDIWDLISLNYDYRLLVARPGARGKMVMTFKVHFSPT